MSEERRSDEIVKQEIVSTSDRLRSYVVYVLLGLLIIVTLADIIDAWFFEDKLHVSGAFYGLVASMIAGLFAGEAITRVKDRLKKNGDSKE